ncbi:MAG: hypothetical protein ACOYYU_06625, partial [Chloroflexota bacterium]
GSPLRGGGGCPCGRLWVVNGGNTLAGTREGGNEFPSQYMEVLRTGADDGARVEGHCGVEEGVRAAGKAVHE